MPAHEYTPDERAALALLWAELGATLIGPDTVRQVELCTNCGRRPPGSFQGRPALCFPCSHAQAFLARSDSELREALGWTWRQFNRYLSRHGERPKMPTRLDW